VIIQNPTAIFYTGAPICHQSYYFEGVGPKNLLLQDWFYILGHKDISTTRIYTKTLD